jgi:hypothetical protein
MPSAKNPWLIGLVPVLGLFLAVGCQNTPVDFTGAHQGPAPLRTPSPEQEAEGCKSYEDSLTGGQIFKMYCSYCHNAPSLAERPYSQFRNVVAHMRVRANLTGKEYAKLMTWLRRWNDIPPTNPAPAPEPSPKRLIFSQPIEELREKEPAKEGKEGKEDAEGLPAPKADEAEKK